MSFASMVSSMGPWKVQKAADDREWWLQRKYEDSGEVTREEPERARLTEPWQPPPSGWLKSVILMEHGVRRT